MYCLVASFVAALVNRYTRTEPEYSPTFSERVAKKTLSIIFRGEYQGLVHTAQVNSTFRAR